jgi:hypothetical protein
MSHTRMKAQLPTAGIHCVYWKDHEDDGPVRIKGDFLDKTSQLIHVTHMLGDLEQVFPSPNEPIHTTFVILSVTRWPLTRAICLSYLLQALKKLIKECL